MHRFDAAQLDRELSFDVSRHSLCSVTERLQVDETPRSITVSKYESVPTEYGIEWESTTIYAKADWYELPPNLRFEYRCQQGAVQGHPQPPGDEVADQFGLA